MRRSAHPPGLGLLLAVGLLSVLLGCRSAPPVKEGGAADPLPRPTLTPLPSPTPLALAVGQCPTPGGLPSSASPSNESEADDLELDYDSDDNTLTIEEGTALTLAQISRKLDRESVLVETAPGEWLLRANLLIQSGASVRLAGPEVRWLKLRSDEAGFVWIKVMGGQLTIEESCLTSWDNEQGGYDQNVSDGRSFLLARDGARLSIRRSELSYLGYDANESYGVSLRLAGTQGEILHSTLGHNFYGLYTYQVSGLLIQGNEVHHSARYGIDPHTESNNLIIEGNASHHNGKHGIILAESCSDSIIRNNQVYENALHGIVLYHGSNRNLVEGNSVYANGQQGINLNAAAHNTVRGNTVFGNAQSGVGAGQKASDNELVGNVVYGNHDNGIYLYSEATRNVLRDNVLRDNGRYGLYVKSEGNRLESGNVVTGNQIGVFFNLAVPPPLSLETNRVYANREAEVRIRP